MGVEISPDDGVCMVVLIVEEIGGKCRWTRSDGGKGDIEEFV